jgi:hypothetical protein
MEMSSKVLYTCECGVDISQLDSQMAKWMKFKSLFLEMKSVDKL